MKLERRGVCALSLLVVAERQTGVAEVELRPPAFGTLRQGGVEPGHRFVRAAREPQQPAEAFGGIGVARIPLRTLPPQLEFVIQRTFDPIGTSEREIRARH